MEDEEFAWEIWGSLIFLVVLTFAMMFMMAGCSFLGTTKEAQLTIDCRDCNVSYGRNHSKIDNDLNIKGL